MDELETLYPGKKLVIEVDHSSGNAKYLPDGLHVSNMNVRYGGKQRKLRASTMTEGCLGPREAKRRRGEDVLQQGEMEYSVHPTSYEKNMSI